MTPEIDTSTLSTPRVTVEVHLAPEAPESEVEALRRGLLATPRRVPSKYFYDARGSELFEAICELPEYYPTRTERALLAEVADEVVRASGAEELVELGSGASTKTRVLLAAMRRAGRLRRYVPFDISEEIVRRVAGELTEEYDDLLVHAVIGDFTRHLARLPDGGRRLVLFLGGTIGNFTPAEAAAFLARLAAWMESGDHLLLGIDLVKDPSRIEAAYDDSQGVTAEFNRNILRVVNAQFDGDFDPARFAHRALYDRRQRWIEMRLASLGEQRVVLRRADLELRLADGEELLTEISTKYDRARVASLVEAVPLEPVGWFTDAEELFGLALLRRQ